MLLVPFVVLKGKDHYWIVCVTCSLFGFEGNRSLLEI